MAEWEECRRREEKGVRKRKEMRDRREDELSGRKRKGKEEKKGLETGKVEGEGRGRRTEVLRVKKEVRKEELREKRG